MFTKPTNIIRVLSGHTSPETAFIIKDYPFGFKKCIKRVWLEFRDGKGYRVVSQTSKPYTGEAPEFAAKWNAPKLGVYSFLIVLYIDDIGHLQNAQISHYQLNEDLESFVEAFGEGLQDPDAQYMINGAMGAIKRYRANPPKWAIKADEPVQIT